jgi:PPM family protein phosphatase
MNGLDIAGKTDPGCVRPNNEDSLAIDEELGLLVVADGMGGHNAGEVASALATSTIKEFARKMLAGDKQMVPEGGDPSLSVRARQLEYFVKTANTMIFEKGRAFPKDHGMGTTVVAVLADGKSLTVAHVGDSRLYLYRHGDFSPLTEDHSLVGDQVKKGLISAAEASRSAMQNILTRALGTEQEVKVDVADHPLLPGDLILLASDGLTKMMTDEEIKKTIEAEPQTSVLVDRLIEISRKAGGSDNITVVAARVGAPLKPPTLGDWVKKVFG